MSAVKRAKKSVSARSTLPITEKPQRAFLENRGSRLVGRWYWGLAAVCLMLCLFFSFYQLGAHPARDWDEARHGVSAYEMIKSGSYLVNTYQYEPDYYNLKPPLSFWGIAAGYRLFGFTLFGMRFYSALSFSAAVAVLGWFCLKRYGTMESLTVLLALTCCAPFYRFHFARHADADALFALFTVLSMLSMLLIGERRWAMPACSGAFALAFLTKSWHALFLVPVVFLFLLIRRLFFRLGWKQWTAFVAAGALPVLLWGLLRYQQDGLRFFSEMLRVDLLNRTTQVLEDHAGGFGYYVKLLLSQTAMTGWFPMTIGGIYAGFWLCERDGLPDNPNLKRDLPFWLLWLALPLLLFSIVKTKLTWYLIPLDIPAVVIGALLLAQLLRGAKRSRVWRVAGGVLAAAMMISSLAQTWEQVRTFQDDPLQALLLDQREALSHTAGSTAKLVIDPGMTLGDGHQKYVLMGELCFDWDSRLGSLDKFLADDQAKIMVADDRSLPVDRSPLAGCRLLAQGDGYFIYEKR